MMIVGNIDLDRPLRRERSSTPSSSGSQGRTPAQKIIRKGLQEAVKEYLQAPPVNTLPRPEFLMAGVAPANDSTCEMSCSKGDFETAKPLRTS